MENIPPTEDQIIELLRQIKPMPSNGFRKKMEEKPWNHRKRFLQWNSTTSLRAITTIGVVLILIIGLSLLTPSLNTLAQRLSQYFSPSPGNQVVTVIPPLKTTHPLDRFNLSIDEAESKAGFKIKEFTRIPPEFILVGAAYDELREAIIFHYSTESEGLVLRISQQRLDSDYQSIGPEAEVEIVQVGPHIGEYVAGGWTIPEVESHADESQSTNMQQTVWQANVNLQILRWSDGKFLYEIILAGDKGQAGYLEKENLIILAEHSQ